MIKYLFKKIARFFVILTDEDKNIPSGAVNSILIIDSGTHEQLRKIILKTKDDYPLAKVSILSFKHKDSFPGTEIIFPSSSFVLSRYRIFSKMLSFKHKTFDACILMSLDVLSTFGALFFMHRHIKHVFLYNRWDETYLMRFRTFFEILSCKEGADVKIKRDKSYRLEILRKMILFIPDLLINIGIIMYLLFVVIPVFIRKDIRWKNLQNSR